MITQGEYSSRRYIVGGVILLVALIILARLFYIQVIDTSYKLSADNNVLRRVRVYPSRGIIYDRKGKILVYNQAAYDMMVIANRVREFDTLALCELLNLTPDVVRTQLQQARAYSRFKPYLFVKQLSAERYGDIQEQLYRFSGFYTVPRTLRYYPMPMAAHLLGYVGEVDDNIVSQNNYYEPRDYVGISGLEKSYEEKLRGVKGVNMFLVDVHNRVISSYSHGAYDTVAEVGTDLHLSLDAELQAFGEYLMRGRRGSIVAIEPSTGEVLAMVSCPAYDPNLLVGRVRSNNFRMLDTNQAKPLFNRSLMAMYPPGSTFKVVNALIGLQEGVITANTGFPCGGRYPYGRGVACHNHPPATSVAEAIKMSCNPYFCYVFRRVIDNPRYDSIEASFTKWREYLENFGLGVKLGIDLPGELSGIVPTVPFYNRYFRKGGWNSLTILSLSIGQGELSFTPLQLANLSAIIANRGYFFTPHVVRKKALSYADRRYVGVDSLHFLPIVEGMSLSVNSPLGTGGTSWRARSTQVEVCGKTGTSQNPHGKDHSVFIGFAPKDNPKIAISVFIENAGFGGTWAAPIGGLMVEKYLCDTIHNQRMLAYIEQEAERLVAEAEALARADSIRRDSLARDTLSSLLSAPLDTVDTPSTPFTSPPDSIFSDWIPYPTVGVTRLYRRNNYIPYNN